MMMMMMMMMISLERLLVEFEAAGLQFRQRNCMIHNATVENDH